MGTRGLTAFVDENDEEIVVMYRQYDAYIDWYGLRLCQYLESFEKIVNGIGGETTKIANGVACLSAQTIMHFKGKIENRDYNNRVFNPANGRVESAVIKGNHEGGVYLYPAGTRDVGEQYLYVVKCDVKKGIHLAAYLSGCEEWTHNGKTRPAVPDELIHAGYINKGTWFQDALKSEKAIQERKEAEWQAKEVSA